MSRCVVPGGIELCEWRIGKNEDKRLRSKRHQHTMGIGVQSMVRRIPTLIGPLIGGLCSGIDAGALAG
jgi:hypothetical protein